MGRSLEMETRPDHSGVDRGGTWDPCCSGCNACTWTDISSSNPIQRKYKGLKITTCPVQLGQIIGRRIKKKTNTPAATSEEPRAKACPLQYHQRGGRPSKPTRETVVCFCSPLPLPPAAGAPIKPYLSFLPGVLAISIH